MRETLGLALLAAVMVLFVLARVLGPKLIGKWIDSAVAKAEAKRGPTPPAVRARRNIRALRVWGAVLIVLNAGLLVQRGDFSITEHPTRYIGVLLGAILIYKSMSVQVPDEPAADPATPIPVPHVIEQVPTADPAPDREAQGSRRIPMWLPAAALGVIAVALALFWVTSFVTGAAQDTQHTPVGTSQVTAASLQQSGVCAIDDLLALAPSSGHGDAIPAVFNSANSARDGVLYFDVDVDGAPETFAVDVDPEACYSINGEAVSSDEFYSAVCESAHGSGTVFFNRDELISLDLSTSD